MHSLILISTILIVAIWSCLTEEPTKTNLCIEKPERYGKEGREGPPGPKGDKGETGRPADMHRITELEEEIQTLKLSVSNLGKRMPFTYWSRYGQKMFATKNDTLIFKEGIKLCKEANGEIAMPVSAGENDALWQFVKLTGGAYLGVNDMKIEGQYEDFNTGNPVMFTNWRSGEPNDHQSEEDCSEMKSDGTWNDLWCKWSRAIICQFKLI
uniref:Mannose-binding protein A-like n=1 Tax=Erpetoichthys calabaricus TaxID=27687 RepID=A0A8C4RNZ6_ERPCA